MAAAAAIAAYLAADLAASLFEFWPGTATLFLPAGVAFSVLVGFGPGHFLTVAAAMLLAAMWPDPTPFSISLIVYWTAVVTFFYTAAAWFLREKADFRPDFRRFRDAAWFCGVVLVASFPAAMIVTLGREAQSPLVDSLPLATAFWIGDSAGILAIAPFVLVLLLPLARPRPRLGWRDVARDAGPIELTLQVTSVVAALAAIAFGVVRLADPALFLLFAPIVWIASRSGIATIVAANAVLTMGAAAGLAAEPIRSDPAILVSSVLIVFTLTSLLLSAAMEERSRILVDLERRERNLSRGESVASLGSWVWDRSTGDYLWSEGLYRIHGVDPSREMGPWEFLDFVAPEDRERVESAARASLDDVRPLDVEYTLIGADGGHRRVIIMGEPEADSSGRAVRLIGTMQDVTARRLAEQEVWQARRMEAIGTLASGVAHDLNNYLMLIQGSAQMLRESGLGDGIEDVRVIDESVRQVRSLNDQLLGFIRGGSSAPENLDLNRELREHEWIFRRMLGPGVTLKLELADDLPPIRCVRAQLEQIVNNLLVNAGDAIGDEGMIILRTVREENGPRPGVTCVRLEVEDNGRGIAPEVLPRIFEAFFTTKRRDGGTGIGLATVRRVVEDLGGEIKVESTPGQGSLFSIVWPPAPESGAAS